MLKRLGQTTRSSIVSAGLVFLPFAAAAETMQVGGTGAAQAIFEQLGALFTKQTGIAVEVIPHLGSSGGIRAVGDGTLDVGVSGRGLKPDEVAKGLSVALTLQTPFVLVTSDKRPNGLARTEVAAFYRNAKAAWADGTPLRPVLRPKSDSDTTVMSELFPGWEAAAEDARKRPEVATAATDQDNADVAERIPGSLTGMTLLQFNTEQRRLRLVVIDGVEPSLGAFEAGSYPFEKKLFVVVTGQPNATRDRFLAFLRSAESRKVFREAGALVIAE